MASARSWPSKSRRSRDSARALRHLVREGQDDAPRADPQGDRAGMRALSSPDVVPTRCHAEGQGQVKRAMWSAGRRSTTEDQLGRPYRHRRGGPRPAPRRRPARASYSERQLYEAALERLTREVAAVSGADERSRPAGRRGPGRPRGLSHAGTTRESAVLRGGAFVLGLLREDRGQAVVERRGEAIAREAGRARFRDRGRAAVEVGQGVHNDPGDGGDGVCGHVGARHQRRGDREGRHGAVQVGVGARAGSRSSCSRRWPRRGCRCRGRRGARVPWRIRPARGRWRRWGGPRR